jgi:hypothetical protein
VTPSGSPLAEVREALQPVRTALRAHALGEAGRIRAQAEAEAAAELARARSDVDRLLEEARDRGRREGEATAAAERVSGRRRARAVVLAARRDAYEEFVRRVRDRARRLREEDGPAQGRLVDLAECELGPGGTMRVEDGAVVAEAGTTRLVWSLDELAARAVVDLGSDVEELWRP